MKYRTLYGLIALKYGLHGMGIWKYRSMEL